MDDVPFPVGSLNWNFSTAILLGEESVASGAQGGHEAAHLHYVLSSKPAHLLARCSTDDGKGEEVFVLGVVAKWLNSNADIGCLERTQLVPTILRQLMRVRSCSGCVGIHMCEFADGQREGV